MSKSLFYQLYSATVFVPHFDKHSDKADKADKGEKSERGDKPSRRSRSRRRGRRGPKPEGNNAPVVTEAQDAVDVISEE